jgi:hypothetical protein
MNNDQEKIGIICASWSNFSRFFYKSFEKLNAHIYGFYGAESWLGKNLTRIHFTLNLPHKRVWYGKWTKAKGYNTLIIFQDVATIESMKIIRKNNPEARLILYCWDTYVDNKKVEFAGGKENNWEIWSFDKKMCEQKHWFYNNQFYPKLEEKNNNQKQIYDFMFVGYNKNRLNLLLDLKEILDSKGFRSKIIVREWSKYGIPRWEKDKKSKAVIQYRAVSYDKILQLVIQSKCLIDIVMAGQTGLSLRVIEAMFYNKKIITNNITIKEYDFYNNKNIFIIGEDDFDKLEEFLLLSYEPIENSILEKYTLETWFNNFFGQREAYT